MNHPQVKVDPTFQEVESTVSDACSRGCFTVLVTDCRVDYHGRSSSKMGWGERVVLLKPDGSVLIHRRTGFEAANWQPPGCSITFSRREGELVIRADRRKPRETLEVICREVALVSSVLLKDEASLDMLISEQDLYSVLRANPDLIEPGFRIGSEQKGLGGGKADITGFDSSGRYTVVEVKRVAADTDAVKQLYRYLSKMRETSPDLRGVLLAPNIRPAAKRLAKSLSVDYRPVDVVQCAAVFAKNSSNGLDRLDRHFI
ncbi:MAG: endonuclease NucS [Thaumarchaeota archaeon]|nr:endonuclease NucS [Nitrososphaerota archaeon]MCL5316795.1 endonuclease NucS [Nitrososphaerota archaeon]